MSDPPTPPEPPEPPTPPSEDPLEEATELLGGVPVEVDESFGLGTLNAFVPVRGGEGRLPTRAVPIVRKDDKIRIDRRGARTQTAQRLMTVAANERQELIVNKKVRTGGKNHRLPRQQRMLKAMESELVKLPITKAIKRGLLKKRNVTLRMRVKTVSKSGEVDFVMKRYRLQAPKPRR